MSFSARQIFLALTQDGGGVGCGKHFLLNLDAELVVAFFTFPADEVVIARLARYCSRSSSLLLLEKNKKDVCKGKQAD